MQLYVMTHRLERCEVAFGIAGWSYPDWEGIVYPPATRDRLRYLAALVDLIEVNASFYGFVAPATAEDWLARTADLPRFRFAAKANRLFTHEDARAFGTTETRAFARGVEPLLRAGRLAALLFQFPFTFRDGGDSRERLTRLAGAFEGFPLVVEVRHASWQADEALAFLGATGFSVASLDLPTSSESFRLSNPVTGEPGYLRLHGRNARDWFSRDAGRDARYDYLYGDEELDELAERIETLAGRFRELIVVTNNHYRGQALANLAELAVRVGAPPRPLPPGLLLTYPRLRAISTAAAPAPSTGRPAEPPPGRSRRPEDGTGTRPRDRRPEETPASPTEPEPSSSRAPRSVRGPSAQRDLFEA